jgi:hypothetical protein
MGARAIRNIDQSLIKGPGSALLPTCKFRHGLEMRSCKTGISVGVVKWPIEHTITPVLHGPMIEDIHEHLHAIGANPWRQSPSPRCAYELYG